MMTRTKIIILSLVMVLFVALFILAFQLFGTGTVTVYGDEYVDKYFQRDKVMSINIEIDADEWSTMLANATAEEFSTATVIVNGDVYPSVRIRPKGNSSLRSVADSDSTRCSLKINFNDLVQNQTMAGLTQLNLNNCFADPSSMREYLSYQIFEEMGVAVPAFSYAAVSVNGEYFGLYLAVESILEPYLERNFSNISGDLYKSVGNTLAYQGNNPADYTGLEVKSTLKNNDWSKLFKLLEVLNNGGDLEKYLDVDAALRYIAVSTALANFDSYQGNFSHNYYLYEQNGIFTILPWDLNMSFGGFSFGGDAANLYIDEPTQGALADRPLIAKLLANDDYLQTYHGYLEQINANFLSGGYLEAETSRLFELISQYVKTDPTAFFTYEEFEQGISGAGTDDAADNPEAAAREDSDSALPGPPMDGARDLGRNAPGILTLAAELSDLIQKQLSGEMPSTNDGKGMGSGNGMFPGNGMPMGNMPGNAAPPSGQPRPGANFRGQENGAGGPGRMPPLPQDVDREAMEAFSEELRQAGELTAELRQKAEEIGIPNELLEMMAGGNRPRDGGNRQPALNKDTITMLVGLPLLLTMAGIAAALFFKRRGYNKP